MLYCKDCKWFLDHVNGEPSNTSILCTNPQVNVNPISAIIARNDLSNCGPEAKLFESK